MFDIYNLMKSGMSAEEIAAEFTQSLNDAETRIEAERVEKARVREAELKRDEKRNDFATITRLFFETIGKHYPEIGMGDMEMTDEECLALADLIIMTIDLENLKIKRELMPPIFATKADKKASAEDVFADFFKKMGI